MAKNNHDLYSEEQQCFRRFVYNTAITLVHEMGHLFITFLNGGESNTPPSEPGGFVYGEAGRELEFILFGGYHAFIRNPHDVAGDAQVCSNLCPLTERLAGELTRNALSSQATLTYWIGTGTSVRSHKRP